MSLDFSLECPCCNKEILEINITHNLSKMAKAAGVYEALWKPEDIEAKYAFQIIDLLKEGIKTLKQNPERFKAFNPENGWGTYDVFLKSVKEVWKGSVKNPYSIIKSYR